jgi:propanol-preferring alcohol dehydrogenase
MAKTMKAAVVRQFGKPLTIEEVPIPQPKAGEILVRLRACGVCGTDLHAHNGDWPVKPKLPFTPGHEGTGQVAGVGPGVTFFKEGDAVGVPWLHTADGHCDYCWSGWESLCKAQKNTGYSVDGCFAEYVIADPNYVARLPPKVDFAQIAPILCAGVTVYKGLKTTEAKPGDWVVISGIGGLGHVAIQYAKAMGMHVAAVDVQDPKLELARKVGATIALNARNTDPAAYLQKEVGGAHAVLVTAPSPKAFEQALGMLRRRGTVTLIGMPPGSFPLNIVPMVLDAFTLRGSIVGGRLDVEEALAFAAEGQVKASISPDRLENINGVFERMRAGQIEGRVVLSLGC